MLKILLAQKSNPKIEHLGLEMPTLEIFKNKIKICTANKKSPNLQPSVQ